MNCVVQLMFTYTCLPYRMLSIWGVYGFKIIFFLLFLFFFTLFFLLLCCYHQGTVTVIAWEGDRYSLWRLWGPIRPPMSPLPSNAAIHIQIVLEQLPPRLHQLRNDSCDLRIDVIYSSLPVSLVAGGRGRSLCSSYSQCWRSFPQSWCPRRND